MRGLGKFVAVGVFVACVTGVGLPAASAKASPRAVTYSPSFAHAYDYSQCDDGGGTAVCAASAVVSRSGAMATEASLRPAAVVAEGGRAEGRGGPQVTHVLRNAVTAVRYRFFFEGVDAAAQKEPAIARDIEARSFVVGYVTHGGCAACTTQVSTLVADADAFSSTPAQVTGQAMRIDVEMRNPAGKVPKGTTRALGFLLSDVGMYEDAAAITSAAQATTNGRLVRVEVEPVL